MDLAHLQGLTGQTVELLKVLEFEDAYIEDELFIWEFTMPAHHQHLVNEVVIDNIIEALAMTLGISVGISIDYTHLVH